MLVKYHAELIRIIAIKVIKKSYLTYFGISLNPFIFISHFNKNLDKLITTDKIIDNVPIIAKIVDSLPKITSTVPKRARRIIMKSLSPLLFPIVIYYTAYF